MIYLEMLRDITHRGENWEFPNCIWAPTKKESGAAWPFWSKIFLVRKDDLIIHLRGNRPEAERTLLAIRLLLEVVLRQMIAHLTLADGDFRIALIVLT